MSNNNNNKVILTLNLFALFSLTSAINTESLNTLWQTWKSTHNKHYFPLEEPHRFAIFQHNIAEIAKLNAQHHPHAKFAVNQFADLTDSEFKKKSTYPPQPHSPTQKPHTSSSSRLQLPDSVDWRAKGAVTPVKIQGDCGAYWAFAATAAIESFYFINNGKLVTFSEQQFIDCADNAGQGCGAGWHERAFLYAGNYGLETEADYPYKAQVQTCQYDGKKALKVCKGFKSIYSQDVDELKVALVESPVAVYLQADEKVFRFYKSGVIVYGCGARINHAALAVGYQVVDGKEAFIVKNSWGTDWGVDGYVYISTQPLNFGAGVCGILMNPAAPEN